MRRLSQPIAPLMFFVLILTSCAPVLTSSVPRAGELATPSSFPLEQDAVAELLAGVEVELGEERAKTAAETQRADGAESQLRAAGRSAILLPTLAGIGGFLLGAFIGGVLVFVGINRR